MPIRYKLYRTTVDGSPRETVFMDSTLVSPTMLDHIREMEYHGKHWHVYDELRKRVIKSTEVLEVTKRFL